MTLVGIAVLNAKAIYFSEAVVALACETVALVYTVRVIGTNSTCLTLIAITTEVATQVESISANTFILFTLVNADGIFRATKVPSCTLISVTCLLT